MGWFISVDFKFIVVIDGHLTVKLLQINLVRIKFAIITLKLINMNFVIMNFVTNKLCDLQKRYVKILLFANLVIYK